MHGSPGTWLFAIILMLIKVGEELGKVGEVPSDFVLRWRLQGAHWARRVNLAACRPMIIPQ